MENINRLYATILLIRCSLFPDKGRTEQMIRPEPDGTTRIAVEGFKEALSDLDRLVRSDKRLELLFESVLSPAAPFLLYRLKSSGYSGCRAVASSVGIHLSALR